MNDLLALRERWELGTLPRPDFSRATWNHHENLFDYPEFLKNTNVRAIEITEEGVKMSLRSPDIQLWCTPQDKRHVTIVNLNCREYESQEIEMFLSLAKPTDTLFDIGANVGLYSIAFAKRFPESKVIAFEPIPAIEKELMRNLILNNVANVSVANFGLSDHCSEIPFYFDATATGATSGAPLGAEFEPTTTIMAPVKTLDSLTIQPDIIKCDVEGAELLVFKGGAKLFAEHRPIIQCEMLRKWSKRFNYHPNDLIAYLKQFGYRCYTLRENALQEFMIMTDETIETNFFFIP